MVQFQPWAKSVVWHGKKGVDSDGNGTLDADEVSAASKRGINVWVGMDENAFNHERELCHYISKYLSGFEFNGKGGKRSEDSRELENHIISLGKILEQNENKGTIFASSRHDLIQQMLSDASRVLGSVPDGAEDIVHKRKPKKAEPNIIEASTAGLFEGIAKWLNAHVKVTTEKKS